MTFFSNTECSICINEYNCTTLKPWVITPCGHTYCKTCLDRIELEGNKCPGCRGPIATKMENRIVLDLMDDINFKSKQLDAKIKLDKIIALIDKLEKETAINPKHFIEKHFENIKIQINKHYNDTIEHLNQKTRKMMQKLDEIKKQTLNQIPAVERLDLVKLKMSTIPDWDKELKNVNVNTRKVEDLIQQLVKLTDSLENSRKNYEHNLLMKKEFSFVPTVIDDNLFGRLSMIQRLATGNIYYIGEFLDGKMDGFGEFHFDNGDRYIGEFKDNQRTGKGTFYWASGNRYRGDWMDCRMDGHGVVYYENGDRTEGTFSKDEKHGEFVYYFKDGRVERQKYENGQRINH